MTKDRTLPALRTMEEWYPVTEEGYAAVLWNDEIHSFQDVIEQVKEAIGCSEQQAMRVAESVDGYVRVCLFWFGLGLTLFLCLCFIPSSFRFATSSSSQNLPLYASFLALYRDDRFSIFHRIWRKQEELHLRFAPFNLLPTFIRHVTSFVNRFAMSSLPGSRSN